MLLRSTGCFLEHHVRGTVIQSCENRIRKENEENVKVVKNDGFISGGRKYNQPIFPIQNRTNERNKRQTEESKQLITEMVFPRILDNLFPLVGADFGWGVPTTTRHQGAEKQILVAAFNVDLKGDMIGESLL